MADRPSEPPAAPSGPVLDTRLRAGRRLWRMRKLHQSVDAELWPGASDEVELRYTLNGKPAYLRSWASRDDAVREAMAKRAELERDGWMSHW